MVAPAGFDRANVTCPDDREIAALTGAQLGADARRSIEAHLDRCETCRRLVAELVRGRGGAQSAERIAGSRIGRFVLVARVGRGGMGQVWSAYDTQLNRSVALKFTVGGLHEAQALAQLTHPNVIRVYDIGEHGDELFIAMELMDGGTLGDYVDSGPRPWGEVVARFTAAGQGLAAAHRAGLVHGDFKAHNVLLASDGRICVTDFGLAQDAPRSEEDRAPDATRPLGGTPAYMSPEQHRGDAIDARSDQFSFCVALFEALYGVRPFPGDTETAVAEAVADGRMIEPPPNAVPRRVLRVIARGLRTEPGARHRNMNALLGALRRAAAPRTARVVVAGTALAATAGWAVWAQGDACHDAAALGGTWDDSARERTRAAFESLGATDVWDVTRPAIDDYASRWSAAVVAACDARGGAPLQPSDPVVACLHRRRAELGAVVDRFAVGDLVVLGSAAAAIGRLRDPARCSTPQSDVDYAPASAAEIDDGLVRVRAALALDDLEQARRAAAALSQLEPTVRDPGGRAVILGAIGRVHWATRRYPEAGEAWRTAAKLAVEHGDRALMLQRWVDLIHVDAQLGRYDVAERTIEFATPLLDEAITDPKTARRYWESVARVREGRSDPVGARQAWDRAVAVATKAHGSEHPITASTMAGRGTMLVAAHQTDAALDDLTRAYAILVRAYGRGSRTTAWARHGLASAWLLSGDLAKADEAARGALADMTAVMPPDDVAVGDAHAVVAEIAARRVPPTYAEARQHFEEAARIYALAVGPDHPEVFGMRLNANGMLLAAGRTAEAVEAGQRLVAQIERARRTDVMAWPRALAAVAIASMTDADAAGMAAAATQLERASQEYDRLLGPQHVESVRTRLELLRLRVALQRPAARDFEDLLAVATAADVDPLTLALVEFGLGEALYREDLDRRRAVALVEGALDRLRPLARPRQEQLLQRWLVDHPAPVRAGR